MLNSNQTTFCFALNFVRFGSNALRAQNDYIWLIRCRMALIYDASIPFMHCH